MRYLAFIFLFLLCLARGQVKSQTVQWSDELEFRGALPEILGESNSKTVTYRTIGDKRKSYIFDVFTERLKHKSNIQVNFEDNENLVSQFLENDLVYLFYSFKSDNLNKELRLQILNLEKKSISKPKKICLLNGEDNQIRIDTVSNKFWVFNHLQGSLSLNYNVLNDSGEVLVNSSKLLSDEGLSLKQLYLSEKGTLLQFEKSGSAFQFYLLDSKLNFRQLETAMSDSFYYQRGIISFDKINNKFDYVTLAGEGNSNRLSALFYASFALDSIFETQITYHKFPAKLLRDYKGFGSSQNGLKDFFITSLIPRSDGGFVMLAENYEYELEEFTDVTIYGIVNTYTRKKYRYGDLLLISINNKRKIDFHDLIKKDQLTFEDNGYFSSVTLLILNSKLIILYNDTGRRNWNLIMSSLNTEGEMHGEILINGNDFKGRLIPKRARQVSGNQIIVPAVDRSDDFLFCKITF